MAIHVALHHRTHYRYDKPVGHGPHVVRLRPAPHSRTRILSYSQRITGGPHFIHWQQDPFSNWNARLTFPEPMEELCLEIDLVAEMSVLNPFDFFLEPQATAFPFLYGGSLGRDLEPFLDVGEPPAPVLDFLHSTCRILLGTDWAFPLAPSVHRVQTIDWRAASTVCPAPSGGCIYCVTGSATEKNIRSMPMPAANSIAAQLSRLNSGLDCSGPSFTEPNREQAMQTTKTI